MSKCENCVHCAVCGLVQYYSNGCHHFKDKSLFVELPCKVGTTVHSVVEADDSKVFNGKVVSITYEQNTIWIYCRYDNGLTYHHTVDDIGKTLFFTEEQAKEKLKEIEGK